MLWPKAVLTVAPSRWLRFSSLLGMAKKTQANCLEIALMMVQKQKSQNMTGNNLVKSSFFFPTLFFSFLINLFNAGHALALHFACNIHKKVAISFR